MQLIDTVVYPLNLKLVPQYMDILNNKHLYSCACEKLPKCTTYIKYFMYKKQNYSDNSLLLKEDIENRIFIKIGLGAIVETPQYIFIAWDNKLIYNNRTLPYNFQRLYKQLLQYIHTNNSIYIYYSIPCKKTFNKKPVFYMVDQDYYKSHKSKCIIL